MEAESVPTTCDSIIYTNYCRPHRDSQQTYREEGPHVRVDRRDCQ